MKRHAAPIIAAILLLLPVLYVGSYLALVLPQGQKVWMPPIENGSGYVFWSNYRLQTKNIASYFYPLEQIDRAVRQDKWNPNYRTGDFIRWENSPPGNRD
jgi:hypothetical protein